MRARAQAGPLAFLLNRRARRWLRAAASAGRFSPAEDNGSTAGFAAGEQDSHIRRGSCEISDGSNWSQSAPSLGGGSPASGEGGTAAESGRAEAVVKAPGFHVKEARRAASITYISRHNTDNRLITSWNFTALRATGLHTDILVSKVACMICRMC